MTTRPHVEVVLAMSADGRIADAMRSSTRIGSSHDLSHLYRRLRGADAVLFGAETLRAVGYGMLIRDHDLVAERVRAQRAQQPVQIVVSRSCKFPMSLPFFGEAGSSRWLLTPNQATQVAGGFDRLIRSAGRDGEIDWQAALGTLAELGVRSLAVLGGGEVVSSLLHSGLVDDLRLTICPLLIGGVGAPTPMDGLPRPISEAVDLELVSAQQVDAEVYLWYHVKAARSLP
jgi:5-amino-6-(5-phosphoribosylamino)uracil reductase